MSFLRRLFVREKSPVSPGTSSQIDRGAVESLLQIQVNNLVLYERALTHRSLLRGVAEPHTLSNERLEFLGDAVLGLVVADHLFRHFPNQDEGFLTRLRAKLVNGQSLARDALELGLGDLILMSEIMESSDGRSSRSILSDAFEAVIGAIYLDIGFREAIRFVERTVLKDVDLLQLSRQKDNYKSLLLELAQSRKWPQPCYRVTNEEGPSHNRTFTVEVVVQNRPLGEGTAKNKKKAEQAAAQAALLIIAEENG